MRATRHRGLSVVPVRRAAAVVLALSLVGGGVTAAAGEDPPSDREVASAERATRAKARDVATVRAELVLANLRLEESARAAAQAAEAWNGARWKASQARQAARAAQSRADRADEAVERQQRSYGSALSASYRMAPQLSALGAIVDADGIGTVIDRTTTLRNAESALDAGYDRFRATARLAEIASTSAAKARASAVRLAARARTARDDANDAAAAAAVGAQDIAVEKDQLIAELAELQDISVALAGRRQAALERAALQQAAAAAQADAEDAPQAETPGVPPASGPGVPSGPGAADPAPADPAPADPAPADPAPALPAPDPATPPAPTPPAPAPPAPAPPAPAPPAPARGAAAAIGYAKAQLGEPYRWGAAGPSSWDCSGLTMRAWAAGGKSLPHYSVAQYEQSTPIGASSLRAGDLVFWGSSSRASSIYHVALYIGGGQIIHAPRAGRPVVQESLYYWIPPNFHARP